MPPDARPVILPFAANGPAARADEAARSVVTTYGHGVLGLPGTHLARRSHPRPPCHDLTWNYWWQAHYLDAVVDAGHRHACAGDTAGARAWLGLGQRLVRGVWLRNVAHFHNAFYDDMAWLILAAGRLEGLAHHLGARPPRATRALTASIAPRLRAAETQELGGGLYWTVRRDRKNVPATAPAAIYFARSGDLDRARRLVAWIYDVLWDRDAGLALDTAYRDGRLDRAQYSYNQGTVLGALLAIGDPDGLVRAAELIRAIDAGLRCAVDRPVLRSHGSGDGGLFTGILVRYLAGAAGDERVEAGARAIAADLVSGTAEALWSGSELRWAGRARRVFATDPDIPAATDLPPGAEVELSGQLQAWTILEAAAALPAMPDPPGDGQSDR